jgi:hypothetical protein
MIPNFEPLTILPRLASLIGPEDYLLLSANLSPGVDYAAGVERILPQYDNELTRDWLLGFLLDLGFEREDGRVRFKIEDDPRCLGLKRVTAYFHLSRPRCISVDSNTFEFRSGESLRLFFSYRHTPASIRSLLGQHGLDVRDQWLTNSGEEGVFLVSKI